MSVTKVTGMMQTGTKGGDIPSASTLVIDTDGDYFDITGTTGITAMTVDAGRRFTLQFDGAVTLTHGSSLYLPGATNFTTEANDCLSFIATAANTVRCTGYALKDGGSPVSAGGAWTHLVTTSVSGASTAFEGLDAYDIYVVVFNHINVNVAGAGGDITVQIGTGATPTYLTSAYQYHNSKTNTDADGYSQVRSDSAAGMLVVENAKEDSNRGTDGHMFIHSGTTYAIRFLGHVFTYDQATTRQEGSVLAGFSGGTSDAQITAIKFITSAGAFDAGKITIYGLAGA